MNLWIRGSEYKMLIQRIKHLSAIKGKFSNASFIDASVISLTYKVEITLEIPYDWEELLLSILDFKSGSAYLSHWKLANGSSKCRIHTKNSYSLTDEYTYLRNH